MHPSQRMFVTVTACQKDVLSFSLAVPQPGWCTPHTQTRAMQNYVSGDAVPRTCAALSELPPPDDAAFICFGGLWCDADGQNCTDLRNCGINGTGKCSLWQSPQLVEDESSTKGSSIQLVYRCRTDWRRVVAFVLGTVCSLLFLGTLLWRMGVFGSTVGPVLGGKSVTTGPLDDVVAKVLAPGEGPEVTVRLPGEGYSPDWIHYGGVVPSRANER